METVNTVMAQTMPQTGAPQKKEAHPHVAVQVMEGISFSVLLVTFCAIYASLLQTMVLK